ncbi:MAG: helix-turn-helix domain-containing protein, partial [Lentisphaeraceae bacterium]|nr:helix-turn-helix domain-containing protein [Lentisphaeraceae bacterium]
MKAKNINIVKGESVQHVCTGTTAGDFAKDDLALNIMYSIHAGDFPRHGHEYDELNIVTKGSAVHVTDFETYRIEKGDVFVINGERQHEFQDCKDLGIAVIQFAPDEIQRNLEDLNLLMGYHGLFDIETRPPSGRAHRQRFKLQTDELDVCQSIFKAMKNEFEEERTGYRVMVRSQFAQLVLLLCRYYEASKQNEDQFAVSMANVASYICQNFKKQIRQEDLAEISGLSVSQMQRRFRSVYGESPVKMINQIRVDEAKKLLKNDVYDLNWIAVQTGYSAASFFSTQFKQFTGMTPREYRKQWQQANETNGKVTSNFSTFKALLLFFTVFSFMSPSLQAEEKTNEIDLLFLRKIKPMLAEKCFGCHGENKEKIKADYIMLDRESLIKGGDSGHAAIIPGDAAKSPIMELIKRIDEDDAMPPKESEKLTAAQIGWMEDWINAGANWPDDSLLENDKNFVKVEVSGALSKDWAERRYNKEDIWAFQPVQKITPPKSSQSHPIDKFIASKLKDNGLKMAKPAEKAKIARRAYLNLTGINPSFKQIQEFVNDSSKGALEKLVDKLL